MSGASLIERGRFQRLACRDAGESSLERGAGYPEDTAALASEACCVGR